MTPEKTLQSSAQSNILANLTVDNLSAKVVTGGSPQELEDNINAFIATLAAPVTIQYISAAAAVQSFLGSAILGTTTYLVTIIYG